MANKHFTHFAVIFYRSYEELGLEDGTPFKFVAQSEYRTLNSGNAFNIYANTRCPASELIQAHSQEELESLIAQSKKNHLDPAWTEENIIPYL